MTSLTSVAITARKIIRYSIFLVIFLIIGRVVLGFAVGIFNKVFPAPPPPPTISFGPLPPIPFPKNENLPQLQYTLQTASGNYPKLGSQAKVYYMPKPGASLNSLEDAKAKAASLGFFSDPVSISQTLYKFASPLVPSDLQMNIITGVFSISFDLVKDPSPLSTRPPAPEVAASNVKNFLGSANLLPEDLSQGTSSHDFLKIENQQLTSAISLSESSLIRINLFRASYDKLPSLPPRPGRGNVWFLVSGSREREKQILGGEYHYFHVDETQSGTYPIKTPSQAYEELAGGKGYIANLGSNDNGKITVRKIYLAYYDPDVQTDFFQPIIVFEGDNGFVAYVPAVTESYYSQK